MQSPGPGRRPGPEPARHRGAGVESGAAAQTLTTLHSFSGGSDGSLPYAALISDGSGALYGTTPWGGAYNEGAVFKLTPPAKPGGAWTETALYSFTDGNDGAIPYAGLIADASGALYGAAFFGGAYGAGTVFKLTPAANGNWAFGVLYTFTGGNDGANPNATLIADATGALYGTANGGGTYNDGTVFRLALTASFIGVASQANCFNQSISFLARKYGGIAHAAATLGYGSVSDLQNVVRTYCGG